MSGKLNEDTERIIEHYHKKKLFLALLIIIGCLIPLSIGLYFMNKHNYILGSFLVCITVIVSGILGGLVDVYFEKKVFKYNISFLYETVDNNNSDSYFVEIYSSDIPFNLMSFQPNYKIGRYIEFDDYNKKIAAYDVGLRTRNLIMLFEYHNVLDFKYVCDETKDYCNKLSINIVLIDGVSFIIDFLNISIKKASPFYTFKSERVNQAASKLSEIIQNNKKNRGFFDSHSSYEDDGVKFLD